MKHWFNQSSKWDGMDQYGRLALPWLPRKQTGTSFPKLYLFGTMLQRCVNAKKNSQQRSNSPVHFCEQLVNSLVGIRMYLRVGPFRSDCVDLVDENNARRSHLGRIYSQRYQTVVNMQRWQQKWICLQYQLKNTSPYIYYIATFLELCNGTPAPRTFKPILASLHHFAFELWPLPGQNDRHIDR